MHVVRVAGVELGVIGVGGHEQAGGRRGAGRRRAGAGCAGSAEEGDTTFRYLD